MVAEALAPAPDVALCKAAVSRELLARCTEFFQKLTADERGGDVNAELTQLSSALSPTAKEVLPIVVEHLGASVAEAGSSLHDDERSAALFSRCSVLHIFAVAHLLGASELLHAAREWVAAKESRLEVALSDLDVVVDAGSLRIALDFGLDQQCMQRSLIHAAAVVDAGAAMKIILERRGDVLLDSETLVDLRDRCGRTPLHTCAMHDSTDAASVLIEASANVEALCASSDEDNVSEDEADERTATVSENCCLRERSQFRKWTPLHVAAAHDSAKMAELLLEARANVAACLQGVQGALTPLHEAAEANAGNVARVLALAASAANIELEGLMQCDNDHDGAGKDGTTKEQQPSEKSEVASKMNNEEQENVRWSRFLDPLNAKCGYHGSTPLHIAAEHDGSSVVRALMEAKADPCLTDDQGDTPLHCALLYGAPGALSELLSHGASMMTENGSGEIALHLCAEFGLGEDSEVDSAMMISEVAMRRHFAKSDRTRDILVSALREKGQLAAALAHKATGLNGGTPLHSIALKNHIGAVHATRVLVEARADLESQDDAGLTPFLIASRRFGDSGKVVMELRRLGARQDVEVSADPSIDLSASLAKASSSLLVSEHDEAFAKALGGYVRPLQNAGGLNILQCVLPKDDDCRDHGELAMEAGRSDKAVKVRCTEVLEAVKQELKDEKDELKDEVKEEIKEEVKNDVEDAQSGLVEPKLEHREA